MNIPARTTFIDTDAALHAFCAALGHPEWVALDTEFLRERTYFPKFCLLQLATPDCVACIDPLTVGDLSPLDPLLDDPHVMKVFHAARQDLEILYQLRGRLPEPVFDTQFAAPFVGLPEQIGYATLAAELLGIRLDKGHTRTDWSARPLSDAQLRYATEDVVYLGQIYLALSEQLERLRRRAWVDEDMQSLARPELYDPDPKDAWLRISGGAQLGALQAKRLAALAAWRERLARTQDCPRNWIVKDDVLLEVARQGPRNAAALKRIRAIDERTAKRFTEDLLTIIHEVAEAPPIAPTLAARPPPSDSLPQEALLDVFSALLRLKGAEFSLNPALIATRRELREFLSDPGRSALLRGWRGAVVGQDLLALMNGSKALRVVEGLLRVSDDVCR